MSDNDDVLALRQKVNKYLASVDEWTKLADKERESADALITALSTENEKLRAFNAAFEDIMESEYTTDMLGDLVKCWRVLKAQYLETEGEDDGAS